MLEIGNTYYVPAMRGTGLNRVVKDLMIGRAIDCGFRRIEFRVDARNARSQAAMAKLGAVREGVIRAERITWTGHVRDTVLFSILAANAPRRTGDARSDRRRLALGPIAARRGPRGAKVRPWPSSISTTPR